MRKLLFIIVPLTLVYLSADQSTLFDKIKELKAQKRMQEALELVEKEIKENGINDKLAFQKYSLLYDLKRYDEGISFIKEEMGRTGKSEWNLNAMSSLLQATGKYKQALKFSIEMDSISERKDEWNCLDIIKLYLQVGDSEKTIDWIEEAERRGLNSYHLISGEEYNLVKNEERYQDVLKRIKDRLGIGKPALDFTATLLNGGSFTLSSQKRKVVLIDFWATWCVPCLEDLPSLKKIFSDFKDRGFTIISISLDPDIEYVKSFLIKEEINWDVICSGKVNSDEIVQLYGVKLIPSYWLIDQNGILKHVNLKGAPLEREIEDLLSIFH